MITFEMIRKNEEILAYIERADQNLRAMHMTEHSLAHLTRCAKTTEYILSELGYDERIIELGKIAAFLHDIGNLVNREDHAHSGAVIALQILTKLGMHPKEVGEIVTAIGYHDEGSANIISEINSALIIADKTDVRHTRVRDFEPSTWDIHDRVNYAAKKSGLNLDNENKIMILNLTIDTEVSSPADYFEIFLGRMLLCKKAAAFFGYGFQLIMNGNSLF